MYITVPPKERSLCKLMCNSNAVSTGSVFHVQVTRTTATAQSTRTLEGHSENAHTNSVQFTPQELRSNRFSKLQVQFCKTGLQVLGKPANRNYKGSSWHFSTQSYAALPSPRTTAQDATDRVGVRRWRAGEWSGGSATVNPQTQLSDLLPVITYTNCRQYILLFFTTSNS